MQQWLIDLLKTDSFPPQEATTSWLLLLGVILFGLLADAITRLVLLRWVKHLLSQTKTSWSDALASARVFHRISHIIPPLLVFWSAPYLFAEGSQAGVLVSLLAELLLLLVVSRLLLSLINATEMLMDSRGQAQRLPIRSVSQLTKLLVLFVFVVLAISLLMGQSPVYFLSGLGAFTAILLLVFRDTILGFVGGVQLAANDMVRRGDWIEMPKFGADGEVIDVALATVKVQNWDKTITTIPTYALISDSFKNWRGMEESGGRRIKRAILLDVNSIRFPSSETQQTLMLSLGEFPVPKQDAGGGSLTNLGLFRHYLKHALQQHPKVNDQMTLLVRQLAPTEFGLPLEIYLFCQDQRWAFYEEIQAELMEFIYATLPLFELRPYQRPGGQDLLELNAQPKDSDSNNRD